MENQLNTSENIKQTFPFLIQIYKYQKEIIDDLIINFSDNQWRVRKSCCYALADLIRSSASINLIDKASELWKQLFRVMDDIHEATRLAAVNTAKILSHASFIL